MVSDHKVEFESQNLVFHKQLQRLVNKAVNSVHYNNRDSAKIKTILNNNKLSDKETNRDLITTEDMVKCAQPCLQ